MVERLFLTVPRGCLQFVIVVFPDHTHLLFLIILCLLIVLGMSFIFMVHLSFYAISLLIYDVIYDITTIPQGTQL